MSISIEQYRGAIGNFLAFIHSKELCYLIKLIRLALYLYKNLMYIFPALMFNISYQLFVISVLLILAGIHPNPGPISFCHLNARSSLSGVDLDTHIASQYSLLDEIYETLVYDFDFDIIAVSETWLKDNIGDDDISLAGYQIPFYRHRPTRGGVLCYMLKKGYQLFIRKSLKIIILKFYGLRLKLTTEKFCLVFVIGLQVCLL